jgi:hypothetical protein
MAKKEYRWNIFLLRAMPATPIGSVGQPCQPLNQFRRMTSRIPIAQQVRKTPCDLAAGAHGLIDATDHSADIQHIVIFASGPVIGRTLQNEMVGAHACMVAQ